MTPIRVKQFLLVTTTLCILSIASAALAQYVWLDEKGNKQYSDMPPPTSVPAQRILKMPGTFSIPPADTSTTLGNAVNNTPTTLAEQNAAFNKRQIDQAEKDKKASESAKEAASKAKNCDIARAYQRTLDSGIRMAQLDNNGQRAFLNDGQRKQASRDNKQVLDDCK
ncbi:DUF4124 domain-containing protein [Glaciimonas sp. GG7]